MKNVVLSAYCNKGKPPGRLGDWNLIRALCEHTCDVHTVKASTARMKSKGARREPCRMPR